MSLRNPERGLFSVKGLIFSLGLIASFIFVGVLYGGLIRPAANKAALAQSYGVEGVGSASGIFVILKDYEQQICISLFLWGIMILIYKFILVHSEATVLGRFAPESEGIEAEPEVDLLSGARSISRERAGKLSEQIDEKSVRPDLKNKILPYVMARGLERYHMTGNVPETTETIMGRLEVASEQQESELSMLRYLVWAIPSIGFIGTVRGIGVALHRFQNNRKANCLCFAIWFGQSHPSASSAPFVASASRCTVRTKPFKATSPASLTHSASPSTRPSSPSSSASC